MPPMDTKKVLGFSRKVANSNVNGHGNKFNSSRRETGFKKWSATLVNVTVRGI